MMIRRLSRAALTAAAAMAALALAACGAQPYPEPSEAPPPPPPPAALLGEPTSPPPPPEPPTALSGEPAPVPPYPEPAPQPPEPAQAYAPTGPVIIAMAPIPNPPEAPPQVRRAPSRTYAPPAPARRYVAPARPRIAAAPASPRVAAPPRPPVAAAPARPRVVAPAPPAPVVRAPAAPPAVAPAAPTATKPATPKLGAAPVLKTPAPAASNAQAPAQPPPSPLGDRATRLAALESILAETVAREAKLTVPNTFTPNQPADVTLAIPVGFAETLRDEAAKNGLSDAAVAVNMTSVLTGDGFAITPDATQSQPLITGQPTEFHWTVTAQPNAKTLHADVGADLIGAGSDMLNLGSVQSGSEVNLTPRILGGAILLLIAVLLAVWLARGRSSPSRSAQARRDARRARRDPHRVMLSETER